MMHYLKLAAVAAVTMMVVNRVQVLRDITGVAA